MAITYALTQRNAWIGIPLHFTICLTLILSFDCGCVIRLHCFQDTTNIMLHLPQSSMHFLTRKCFCAINVLRTYQWGLNHIFVSKCWNGVESYIDDLSCNSSWEDHMALLCIDGNRCTTMYAETYSDLYVVLGKQHRKKTRV